MSKNVERPDSNYGNMPLISVTFKDKASMFRLTKLQDIKSYTFKSQRSGGFITFQRHNLT